MGSEEKIIPIARGERKPKQGSFAAIAGKTLVDVAIEAAQSIRRRPASLVELVKKQGHSGTTPDAFTRSNNSLNGERSMSSAYTITEDNAVRPIKAEGEPVERAFASVEEFAQFVADWPLRRLVEIWNKLPGVRPLSRFENREVAVQRIWRALHNEQQPARAVRASRQRRLRASKTQIVLSMLRQPQGATLKALMKATHWQAHSVRGFLSRKVARSLGLPLQSTKRDGQRVYAIPPELPPG